MLGSSLRDLLEHCKAAGTFSGDSDQYVSECVARTAQGKITSTAYETKDGRINCPRKPANAPWRVGRHARRHHRAPPRCIATQF
jgi:hypothetical protein